LHLKQQIEEKYADVKPARIFRGVQHDSTRKGELFGMENLLKFKDGSFIADLWSSKLKKCQTDQTKPIIHQGEEVSAALGGLSAEEVENLGGLEDCFITLQHSNDVNEGINCPDIQSTLKAAVQNNAFFREDEGEAVQNMGDRGFDQDIGQASQLAALACDVLCQDSPCDGSIRPEEVLSAVDVVCINHLHASSVESQSKCGFHSDSCLMGSEMNVEIERVNDSIPIATEGYSRSDTAVSQHEKEQKDLNFSLLKPEQHDKVIRIMGRQVSKGNLHKSQIFFSLPKYMKNSLKSCSEA